MANSYEFNHGATFFSAETRQLFVGGLNGYTILDMETPWFYKSEPLPNYITEISMADNRTSKVTQNYTYPYQSLPKIVLQPTQDFVNIHIGNPKSYRNKERVGYKVDEIVETWQELKPGHPISLIGLAPSEYNLEITNDLDQEKSTAMQLEIVKLPMFYQTWWFRTLIASALMALVGVAYRWRIDKIRRELELRTRISSDLHDEVGSLLTGISMQAEFVQLSKEDVSKRTYLKAIAQSSKEAIRAMGDIVWSIDARNDNWESLVIKLREYAHDLFDPAGIDFTMGETGASPSAFSQQVRHTIYLIVKEALNNISKHSKATHVWLSFVFTAEGISFRVKDNGVGFKEENEKSGQGIENMKTRAAKIKAEFKIHHLEKGTEIKLRIKT